MLDSTKCCVSSVVRAKPLALVGRWFESSKQHILLFQKLIILMIVLQLLERMTEVLQEVLGSSDTQTETVVLPVLNCLAALLTKPKVKRNNS